MNIDSKKQAIILCALKKEISLLEEKLAYSIKNKKLWKKEIRETYKTYIQVKNNENKNQLGTTPIRRS